MNRTLCLIILILVLLSLIFIPFVFIKRKKKKNVEFLNMTDDKYLDCSTTDQPKSLVNQKFKKIPLDFKFETKKSPRQIKKIKSLLRDTIKVLEKNKLTYFLGAGTLLGSYRQGDFTPWDDDADIMIRVEDHDKLFSLKDKFKKYGITLSEGCLSCWAKTYNTVCQHLKKTHNDLSMEVCNASRYFSAVNRDGEHMDIFKIFPIESNGKKAYSLYGVNRLISEEQYKNMFPGKPCTFGDIIGNCPNNTKELLCRNYKDIKIPMKNSKELSLKDDHVFGIEAHGEGGLHLDENLQLVSK